MIASLSSIRDATVPMNRSSNTRRKCSNDSAEAWVTTSGSASQVASNWGSFDPGRPSGHGRTISPTVSARWRWRAQ